jgi:DNA-binding CsgD family transcriptional regulator
MSSVFDFRGSVSTAPAVKLGRPPGKERPADPTNHSVIRIINGERVTEPVVPLNPWGLTLTHAEVMDALCDIGILEIVAQRMKIRPNTVSNHTAEIRQRMGVPSTILAAVKWTLWRQANPEAVA